MTRLGSGTWCTPSFLLRPWFCIWYARSFGNSHAVGIAIQASNITKVLAACLWFELTDKIGHFVRGKDDKAVGLSSTSIGCDPT